MKNNLLLIMKNAYAPISKYKVSCIVKCKNGQEFIGVNIENKDGKSGMCAEQVAIASAFTDGYKCEDFMEIHVMGSGNLICKPCFFCRELISEYFDPDAKIFCYNKNGKCEEYLVKELCPNGFNLEENNDK